MQKGKSCPNQDSTPRKETVRYAKALNISRILTQEAIWGYTPPNEFTKKEGNMGLEKQGIQYEKERQ